MTTFLTKEIIYRILQRESPQDVYADGSPSGSFTAADYYSSASATEQVYDNLEKVYLNIFPPTVDENIREWEETVFDRPQPVLPTLEERRDRVIQKLRLQRGITVWDMLTLIATYLPEGVYVGIREKNSSKGAWMLGKSKLGSETFLNGAGRIYSNSALCARNNRKGWKLGSSKLGVSTYLTDGDQEASYAKAYAYVVSIYDYTLPADLLSQLYLDLTKFEPARSLHFVFQNISLADSPWQTDVANVGQMDNINVIARDSTQATGYKGRVA